MPKNRYAKFSGATIQSVLNKTGGKCWYCGIEINIDSRYQEAQPFTYVIDHLIPQSNGGTSEERNLVPSCWSCNSSKRATTIEEFRFLRARQKAGMPKFSEEQIAYLCFHGIKLPTLEYFVFYFEKEGLTP